MTITGIISAILIGLVIGALGRLVVPGKQRIPIWLTILVGIGAAFLGTALARAMGNPNRDQRHRLARTTRAGDSGRHRRRNRGGRIRQTAFGDPSTLAPYC